MRRRFTPSIGAQDGTSGHRPRRCGGARELQLHHSTRKAVT
jgi:hypothetical protein